MSDTCPYCPPADSWGMGPDGWASYKTWHDAGHPTQTAPGISPDASIAVTDLQLNNPETDKRSSKASSKRSETAK